MLVLTPLPEITLTKSSKFDTFREPRVLWTSVITKSERIVISSILFRLGFLFAHLQTIQRKSKSDMNLLSCLLTVIKFEDKGRYCNKRMEPSH